jgi:hypothetical protein
MSSTAGIAIAAVSSGAFALLGVVVSDRLAARRDRTAFRQDAAVELADTEQFIWQDNWVTLNIALEKLETRLLSAGISEDLASALHEISAKCWKNLRFNIETHGEEEGAGIINDFLVPRRLVVQAIVAELLKSGDRASREQLRKQALESVKTIDPFAEKMT